MCARRGGATELAAHAEARRGGASTPEPWPGPWRGGTRHAYSAARIDSSGVPFARDGLPGEVLVVDDDGPGLTPAQRDQVARRGQRLDETKPGSGLGLRQGEIFGLSPDDIDEQIHTTEVKS